MYGLQYKVNNMYSQLLSSCLRSSSSSSSSSQIKPMKLALLVLLVISLLTSTKSASSSLKTNSIPFQMLQLEPTSTTCITQQPLPSNQQISLTLISSSEDSIPVGDQPPPIPKNKKSNGKVQTIRLTVRPDDQSSSSSSSSQTKRKEIHNVNVQNDEVVFLPSLTNLLNLGLEYSGGYEICLGNRQGVGKNVYLKFEGVIGTGDNFEGDYEDDDSITTTTTEGGKEEEGGGGGGDTTAEKSNTITTTKLPKLVAEAHSLTKQLINSQSHLSRRELRMHQTSISTNKRVLWLSVISVFVLVFVGGLQYLAEERILLLIEIVNLIYIVKLRNNEKQHIYIYFIYLPNLQPSPILCLDGFLRVLAAIS